MQFGLDMCVLLHQPIVTLELPFNSSNFRVINRFFYCYAPANWNSLPYEVPQYAVHLLILLELKKFPGYFSSSKSQKY
jgi:hypothetical protein